MERRRFIRNALGLTAASLLAGCGKGILSPSLEPEDGRLVKPGVEPMSIGSTRYRVRNEMWYALRKEWLTKGDDPLGPGANGTLSNWNWLSKNADANANGLRFALGVYGGFVSNLIPGEGGTLTANQQNYWTDRLSADAYALGFMGSSAGHGCQCVSFVAMGIYRATGGTYTLRWSWAAMEAGSFPPATQATPGDVVFKTSAIHHVGICVRNYGTGITVVDSNSLGNEVIRRHDISNTQIGNTWKLYTGSGRWY